MAGSNLDEYKEQYRSELEIAANAGSTEIFGNRYPWQIKMAVQSLLCKASRESLPVRIVCGGIANEFYEENMSMLLRVCLKSNCHVQIVVWNNDMNVIDSNICELSRDYPELFELRWAGELSLQIRDFAHFMLIGDSAFRQENPHREMKNEKWSDYAPEIPARISFNFPSEVKKQRGLFELIWGLCEVVPAVA
jgi:hypothetical protein